MLLNREKRLEVYHHTSQDRSTTALLASNNRDANRGYNNRGTNRGRSYNSGRGNGHNHGRGNGRNTNRTTFNRKKNSRVIQWFSSGSNGIWGISLICCSRIRFRFSGIPGLFSFSCCSGERSFIGEGGIF